MKERRLGSRAKSDAQSFKQAERKNELKDQNPNQGHNAKKVSLGPNTDR